jgi:hypothetical protein
MRSTRSTREPSGRAGAAYDEGALDELLRERVVAVVTDIEGREEIRDLLADLPATEFEARRLADLIDEPRVRELWRVGEAIGEVFLVDCRNCFFPWPSGRDLKNPYGSLPGADLVGFAVEGESERFAFGEVKTSQSQDAPPSVMYGRSGLVAQLEGLRDDVRVKDALVLYLGFRANNAAWYDRYRDAARRYFADHTDVSLFGVLVRDVEPNPLDVQKRAATLAQSRPAQTSVELRAKYLPAGTLSAIVERIEELARDAGHD